MNRFYELLFWLIISLILVVVFGSSAGSYIHSLYFVLFFMPITIATSWFVNTILINNFLLRKKYLKFFLYLFYTIVVSVNLTFILVFVSFLLLIYYRVENLWSVMTDFRIMPLIMFLLVLVYGFVHLVSQLIKLQSFTDQQTKNDGFSITVRSERKNRLIVVKKILYIESMADYVRIFLDAGDKVITRTNISFLENELGNSFLRIHRSYLVNRGKIESYTKEKIVLAGKELPISRTYKDSVITALA